MKKTCSKCKKSKSINEFHIHIGHKDGFSSVCKECCEKYRTKYYKKHKKQYKKLRNKKKENKKKYNKIWSSKNKLSGRYNGIKQRCNNPNTRNYKHYGGRGIKCLMTFEELKYLWNRDKAYNMDRPSIDRIDNDGNYEVSNCEFMELRDNIKKMNVNLKKKT